MILSTELPVSAISVTVIDEIAFQTNLLALNASVDVARARDRFRQALSERARFGRDYRKAASSSR